MTKISMKDIAKLSGVSVATVSRVINDNGRFSEETRLKVLKVIEKTGYKTNHVAKSLRMNKTNSIGVVVPDITNNFFAEIVQEIEEVFFEQSYSTIICNSGGSTEKEKLYLKTLESKMVDGIIFISGVQKFEIDKILSKNLPIIYIDREPKSAEKTIYISSDHYQGAKEATSLLLNNGAKHPAFLNHSRMSSSINQRLEGFIDALEEYNIEFNHDIHLIQVEPNAEISSTLNVTETLEKYYKKNRGVDAIFAANDLLAIYTVNYFLSINKKIPSEIQIIGFDDNPIASQFRPRLSSIRQNTEEIVKLASQYLLKLMKEESVTKKNIYIPTSLINRDTTFPAYAKPQNE